MSTSMNAQNVQPETSVVQQHAEFHELSAIPGVRIGVSCVSTDVAMLGESTTSWAFASAGRKSGGGGGFLPYGTPFGVGDEVHISLLSKACLCCCAVPVHVCAGALCGLEGCAFFVL